MTRKTALAHNQELQTAIAEMRGETDGRQIFTRSQQQLEEGMVNVAKLQGEAKIIRNDIRKTRANIVQLTKLLDTLEGQEQDIAVLLKSELDRVHALQTAGISLD